jgi:nucleoid-associated protein YgaU
MRSALDRATENHDAKGPTTMGIFDFLKDKGEKLPEETKAQLSDVDRSAAIAGIVNRLGLNVDDLKVEYHDGTATVHGTVPSQADREKVILAVGNIQGIAAVDDRLEVIAPAPEAKMYTVQSGDSLSKIAKEFYGDAMKYPVIVEANQPMLSDPDKIYPGQVLRIPPV